MSFSPAPPPPRASLIVTTYNWPEALRALLLSALGQRERGFELLVADDGSLPATATAVKETLGGTWLPWTHVRQEDQGIRQARVKNLAARYARGPYFIFVDHDVLLHPDFIGEHLADAGRGHVLQGKRSFLPPAFSTGILQGASFAVPGPFLPGLQNRKNALHLPRLGRLLSVPRSFQTSLRGCNLSMTREDFLLVDGYDETFDRLWGREDSDICYRLFHAGVRCRNLAFRALVYHLDHPVRKNRERDRLDEELAIVRRERRRRALHGFSRLSGEGGILAQS